MCCCQPAACLTGSRWQQQVDNSTFDNSRLTTAGWQQHVRQQQVARKRLPEASWQRQVDSSRFTVEGVIKPALFFCMHCEHSGQPDPAEALRRTITEQATLLHSHESVLHSPSEQQNATYQTLEHLTSVLHQSFPTSATRGLNCPSGSAKSFLLPWSCHPNSREVFRWCRLLQGLSTPMFFSI